MDLKKINDLLSNLNNISKKAKLISTDKSDNYNEEKDQGTEGVMVEIYDIGEENTFLKVVTNSDSYGDKEHISSISFVHSETKTITVYN